MVTGLQVGESGKYQPQLSQLEPVKPVEMKPVKQTVTYDSSTGKMYEELGSSGSSAAAQPRTPNYFQVADMLT